MTSHPLVRIEWPAEVLYPFAAFAAILVAWGLIRDVRFLYHAGWRAYLREMLYVDSGSFWLFAVLILVGLAVLPVFAPLGAPF